MEAVAPMDCGAVAAVPLKIRETPPKHCPPANIIEGLRKNSNMKTF